MGQLTGAGVVLPQALEQLRRHPPARAYRQPLGTVLQHLNAGCTFSESLQQVRSWVPAFDLALLQAGEQSGRLDASFRLLSDHYRDRARLARQLISDLVYPAFLLHFAVLIFSFVEFVRTWDWRVFILRILLVLVPIYAVVLLGIFAGQSKHGETWRAFIERLLTPVPVLGTARRYLALARLSASLEALLAAGVTIVEAWELAAAASGSPRVRRVVIAWRPMVDAGQTPAEAVRASAAFPTLFTDQYATGEISGQLDEVLRRLHLLYQEEGTRKLRAFTQWVPRGIYLGVMLSVAYMIVRFYLNYFQQIGAAGGF